MATAKRPRPGLPGAPLAPEQDFYRFRSFEDVGRLFGLSAKAMTVLAEEEDFPVFARKVSPALMAEWLRKNAPRLRLIKTGE